MTIEISFGRLANKFRIIKTPLQCSLDNSPRLFLCATRLQIFGTVEGQVVSTEEHDAEGQLFLSTSYFHAHHGCFYSGQFILR